MSIFKKNQAITIEKMDVLSKVVINQEKVEFSFNYSSISLKPEDVPKLLADVMQLYAIVKPTLDRKSIELKKQEVEKLESDTPDEIIDLSEIPF